MNSRVLQKAFLFLIFILSQGLLSAQQVIKPTSDSTVSEKWIMLVYSKEKNNERTREFNTGFSTYHSNNKTNTRISNLYINSEGDRTKEQMISDLKAFWKTYDTKFPDLVIATDTEALDVLLSLSISNESRRKILCVKILDNNYKPEKNVSYIHLTLPIKENIELSTTLFPNSRDILIITDNSDYGAIELEYAKKVIASLPQRDNYKFKYLSPKDESFDDFIKRINSMPLKSIAILSSWLIDKKGDYFYNNSSYPFLSKINNIPVFGIQNLLAGAGIFGGYSVSSWEQGYNVADISIKMFEEPNIIISDTLENYTLKFDFNELKRWNISTEKLPKHSVIINKPTSIYDAFKSEVQLFMAFITLLITSFMVFTVYHFRYRGLNKELIKQTSENLSRRELLNNTFSVIEEGVISFDPKLSIIYANEVASSLSEKRKVLFGKKFHDIYKTNQPEGTESIQLLLKQAVSLKKASQIPEYTSIEYQEIKSRFISGKITPILDSSGEVSQVVLIMKDVTDLFSQRKYLNLAIRSAKAFIWFYNISTKQHYIIDNRDNISWNWREEFITHEHFLQSIHPDDRDSLAASYDNLLTSSVKGVSVEYRLSHDNGKSWEWWESRWIPNTVSVENNSSGGQFLYGMDINIQEIKMREKGLLQAKLEAEEIGRLKNSFLSNISNEIQAPLKSIVDYANLITNPSCSEKEKSEFASIINSNSKSLITLMTELIDSSQLEPSSFTNNHITEEVYQVVCAAKDTVKTKVLIAEDLDSNFMLLEIILSKKYNLARALNGEEAVAISRIFNPDIILMDIKMPIMNGLEATRSIRKTNADIPIIALTANAFNSDLIDAKLAGCNEVLTKPVKASILISMIEKYTNRKTIS